MGTAKFFILIRNRQNCRKAVTQSYRSWQLYRMAELQIFRGRKPGGLMPGNILFVGRIE